MSVLKMIMLLILGLLALYGGMCITFKLPHAFVRHKVKKIARKCDDCTCGSQDIELMVNKEDHSDVRIKCARCGRLVMHGDLVKRWNAGESDKEENRRGKI